MHASDTKLKHVSGINLNKIYKHICAICPLSKQQIPFLVRSRTTITPFNLVHIDLWGPYKINSITGATFMVTIIDLLDIE